MTLLPAPSPREDRLLVFAASEPAAVLAAAALARRTDQPLGMVFADAFDLGRLATLPAFACGLTRTVVLDFPAPPLARAPEDAARALRQARDLLWVSRHPLDLSALGRLEGVRAFGSVSAPGQVLSTALGLDPPLALAAPAEVPDPLPPPADPAPALAWRFAIEAARQEPRELGLVARRLASGEPPEPELAAAGRSLIAERREIARTSGLHLFRSAEGLGVVVPVPRAAQGFYRDLARDARSARSCSVSLLAYDSHEPALVEYASPPRDLEARIALARARLPGHEVHAFGAAGFVVRGPATGSLEVLERLLAVLGSTIN